MNNKKSQPESVGYIPMIVEALQNMNGVAKAAAVKEWIKSTMANQNKEIPEIQLSSGVLKFTNDVQWARMYLVNAGFLEPMDKVGYGIWKLTAKGWSEPINTETAKAIYGGVSQKNKSQKSENEAAPIENSPQLELQGLSSWEKTLVSTLKNMHPTGFERFCAELMTLSCDETSPTGKTGDGGVDGEGTLILDEMGLIKTYVAWQCKCFGSNKVAPTDIQAFRGAISGRADYGLFFTTSTFTQGAKNEARRPGATPIELIDIDRLIKLIRIKSIGLKKLTPIEEYEVDEEYFKQYINPAEEQTNKSLNLNIPKG